MRQQTINTFIASTCLLLLVACASDRAMFVTKSSLSVLDIDSTPASVSIAYDRVEGFIGPAFDGGTPPVVGVIRTDGQILTPKVRQIYATGNAALVVSGLSPGSNGWQDDLVGNDRWMFFGTSTTLGLKLSADTTYVPNVVFGFRRKEFSMLPLGDEPPKGAAEVSPKPGPKKTYPSTLAFLDTIGSTETSTNPSLKTIQYFATGPAATRLANDPGVKAALTTETSGLFGEFYGSVARQATIDGDILICYAGVPEGKKPLVWENAQQNGVFTANADKPPGTMVEWAEGSKPTLAALKQRRAQADAQSEPEKSKTLANVNWEYAGALRDARQGGKMIRGNLVGNPLRETLLSLHREFTCELAAQK